MSLTHELRRCLDELDRLIDAAKEQAEHQGIDPYRMLTPSGVPVLAPLLSVKGQCLSTLTLVGDDS